MEVIELPASNIAVVVVVVYFLLVVVVAFVVELAEVD